MESLADEVALRLTDGRRERFMAALVLQLSIAGRSNYVEADNDPSHALRALWAINECYHEVGNVLVAAARGDEVWAAKFADDLLHKAEQGGTRPAVEWALKRAVALVDGDEAGS